jgi:hypothetical protein
MQVQSWRTLALAAAVLALPGAVSAQTNDTSGAAQGAQQADSVRHGRVGGPAAWILSRRTELKLTDDQVQKLEAIRTRYDGKNQPYRDKLRQAWGDSAAARPDFRTMSRSERRQAVRQMREQRRQYLAEHPDVADALKQLRANQDAARKEALAVLTPAQRDEMKRQAAQWRAQADSAHRGGRHGRWRSPGSE